MLQTAIMHPGLSTLATSLNSPEAPVPPRRMGCKMDFSACARAFVLGILIVVSIGLFLRYANKKEQIPFGERIICPGFHDARTCIKKGCVWDDSNKTAPHCFLKRGAFGYIVKSDISQKADCSGYVVNLEAKGSKTPYGESSNAAFFEVTYISERILRFKVYDRINSRYTVPIQDQFKTDFNYTNSEKSPAEYEVNLVKKRLGSDFAFYVKRRNSNTVLFDTRIGGLMMAKQYLQIASYLPSSYIYGLGENNHATFRHDLGYKSWPIFSSNQYSSDGHKNLYGAHPFYTCLEEDGKSHGVLFLNSNAMEVTLMPAPAIAFRTTGGILDFFVFVGDNPEHVIQLYTSVIGRPMLPPYWSLGFHFDLGELINVEDQYEEFSKTLSENEALMITPSEVHYTRINKETWSKLNGAQEERKTNEQILKSNSRGIIPRRKMLTIDSFAPFLTGLEKIMEAIVVDDPRRSVKPPNSLNVSEEHRKKILPPWLTYPDFFSRFTHEWWMKILGELMRVTNADGIYLEMNEPTFLPENSRDNIPSNRWVEDCPSSPYDNPPYNPLLEHRGQNLSFKTLCMASVHSENSKYLHYDVHNINGLVLSNITQKFYSAARGYKALVMSQSTYVSSGTCSGHILGNHNDDWQDLRRSIVGVLEFNLFGIPFVGIDVCNFHNKATDEICKRSIQLGAYLPFYRNRYYPGHEFRGPASFIYELSEAGYAPGVQRSKLLPHLYTLLYKAHKTGSTVVRPLFHEFPQDENTWKIDMQFMWGSNMIISPILEPGPKNVRIYLPNDTWYRFDNSRQSEEEKEVGKYIEIEDIEEIPVHIRGGSIIPTQVYRSPTKRRSYLAVNLLVFPKDKKAQGELYSDTLGKGNVRPDFMINENYMHFKFTYLNCSMTIEQKFQGYSQEDSPILYKITVHNAVNVKAVYVNDEEHNSFKFHEPIEHLQIYADKPLAIIKKITWCDKVGRKKRV